MLLLIDEIFLQKASDLICTRALLDPLEVPVYIAPEWETRQR